MKENLEEINVNGMLMMMFRFDHNTTVTAEGERKLTSILIRTDVAMANFSMKICFSEVSKGGKGRKDEWLDKITNKEN